jgi:hypothetical protein
MLRFGLRYGLGPAACAAALCGWQQGALAWSATVKQGAGSSLLVAAKDNNSSIAVAKSKKHKIRAPVAAEQPVPPLPDKKDDKKDDKAATGQAPPAPPAWKPEEIAAAQARCTAILKGIDAVAEPQPPLREGACGAPAPIRLISLGKSPQVAFSPPALVDCELAGAVAGWLKNDVQPLALKHLGAKIVRIEVMSDYSCRTSAGRGAKYLSEHAFANALDIGAFVTDKGNAVSVLNSWGTPKREIAERIAAEKAAAEKAEKETATLAAADAKAQQSPKDPKSENPSAEKKPAPPPVAVASSLGTPASGSAKSVRSKGVDKITITLPGSSKSASDDITKLGGPRGTGARKPDATADVAALPPIAERAPGPQAQFLHEAHAAACRIFGTTLGPEANADHRNHFHVDMAERKYRKICD